MAPQVDFVYLTGRVFELFGLASDIRVEVPVHLKPDRQGAPPVGLPIVSWTASATVWALVLSVAHQLHARSARGVAAPRVLTGDEQTKKAAQ